MSAAEIASVSSDFDIFAHRPRDDRERTQTNLPRRSKSSGNFIPADIDKYIDLDIKVYVRGKFISASGKEVDFTDLTGVTNNFLHSLFSHHQADERAL